MNKRATGTIFCVSAAIIYAMKYLVTAVFMSGVSEWSKELFENGLSYTGNNLTIISIILLIIGIVYLIWEEIEEKNSK